MSTHQYLNRVEPQQQQAVPGKHETAYIFLYVALAVGAFLLGLVALGLYRDHMKKSKGRRAEREEASKRQKRLSSGAKVPLYPDIRDRQPLNNSYGTPGGGSIPSVSTTTEEVQPKQRDVPYYPPTTTTPTTLTMDRESPPYDDRNAYAKFNNHQKSSKDRSPVYPDLHQKVVDEDNQQQSSSHQSHHQSERRESEQVPPYERADTVDDGILLDFELFPNPPNNPPDPDLFLLQPSGAGPTGEEALSSPSGPSANKRKESFPFEKFGIPLEERESRTTRVENMRPISNYFHLATGPSFFLEDDEEEYKSSEASSTNSNKSGDEGGNGNGDNMQNSQDREVEGQFTSSDTLSISQKQDNSNKQQ